MIRFCATCISWTKTATKYVIGPNLKNKNTRKAGSVYILSLLLLCAFTQVHINNKCMLYFYK